MCRLRTGGFLLLAVIFVQAFTACGSHQQSTPGVLPQMESGALGQGTVGTRHGFAAASSSTSYSDAVLASGPAAYYHLDDTTLTAIDSSPNHFNGNVGAAVSKGAASLVPSSSDTAMTFPGVQNPGGSVVVPPTTVLQPQSQVSIELFLRFTATPTNFAVPVSYGSDSKEAPYDIYFLQSGKISAHFNLTTGVAVAVTGPLQPNTTYHVVATFDGSTTRLYLNGALAASTVKAGTLTGYDTTHGLAIGDDAGFSDPGFAGSIDEVAIYTKVLAASDVSAHYAAAITGGGPAPTPTPIPPPPPPSNAYSNAVLASNPLAYYRLTDSGSTALDSSPNHLNGSAGSSVTKGVSGLVASSSDTAFGFPGSRTAAGTVDVPPTKLLQPQSAASMELFLRFSSTPADYSVPVSYGSDFVYAPYDMYFQSGKLAAQFTLTSGELVVFSPAALQPNTTYDVVATFDGGTARLYLNGSLVASSAKSGALTAYDSTHGLAIGDDAGFADPGFAGTIGQVAIYGTALTASAVSAHYAAATSGGGPPPPPSSYVDWSTFGFDMARTGNNPSESALSAGTVGGLQLLWSQNLPSVVSAQPILASGVQTAQGAVNMLYVGSQDGTFAAFNADTGAVIWQNKFGSVSYSCGQTGVNRSAAFDRATSRVYFEDGQEQLHALDMATGKEASGWPVTVGGTPGQDLPHGAMNYNPSNHLIYTTSSQSCDIPPWHGRVAAINTQNASVANTFFTVPGGSGGGIWGQGGVSIDPQNGNVFAAVGNADTTNGANQNLDYSENVLSLTATLGLVGANYPGVPPYNLLPGSPPQGSDNDEDFGATPTLFTGPDGSACAAAINKSGLLVLYNRGNIGGGYTQYLTVNPPTDDADLVGLPAYSPATTLLYVPLPNDFVAGGTTYTHGLAAFKAQSGCTVNGTPAWDTALGILPSQTSLDDPHSPPTVANGVVYIGDGPGNHYYALNALTGSILFTSPSVSGAYVAPVADKNLYLATYGGSISAYATSAMMTQSHRRFGQSIIAPPVSRPHLPRWSVLLKEFHH